VTTFRLIVLAFIGSAQLLTRSEDRLALSALSGCGMGNPQRLGGELSVESGGFFIKNITAGMLALWPVSQGKEPFELAQGMRGVEGMYLGLRHRFPAGPITPFVGLTCLEHFLSEEPYASINPEAGVSYRFHKDYEFTAQLRYFLTSRGRGADFLVVGCGVARLF
jgi:hypothetical protein